MGLIDIKFNDDGTFQEENGDFVLRNAESNLMADLLISAPGHWKEFPTLGANVLKYANARSNSQVIERDIKVALKADVFRQPTVDTDNFPTSITVDNLELELVQDDV